MIWYTLDAINTAFSGLQATNKPQKNMNTLAATCLLLCIALTLQSVTDLTTNTLTGEDQALKTTQLEMIQNLAQKMGTTGRLLSFLPLVTQKIRAKTYYIKYMIGDDRTEMSLRSTLDTKGLRLPRSDGDAEEYKRALKNIMDQLIEEINKNYDRKFRARFITIPSSTGEVVVRANIVE